MPKFRFAILSALLALALAACGTNESLESAALGLTASGCTFVDDGAVMTLTGDCTTDATIHVPDGYTLDSAGFTITAVDPVGDHFRGAVVANAGATAHVRDVTITADGLANVCDAGDDRLRGIRLDNASGSIVSTHVTGLRQEGSGCQEGNAIEVSNYGGAVVEVEIAHNVVTDFMKTGILVTGAVTANVHHNTVFASANQANLAANSIQVSYGAGGVVTQNEVHGNQWCGGSDWAATAVLVLNPAPGLEVSKNSVRGNADVGIYFGGDSGVLDNNRVFEDAAIADCNPNGYDFGIGDWGTGNTVTNNKVRGYDTPYDGVDGGGNKTIPSPQTDG